MPPANLGAMGQVAFSMFSHNPSSGALTPYTFLLIALLAEPPTKAGLRPLQGGAWNPLLSRGMHRDWGAKAPISWVVTCGVYECPSIFKNRLYL